MGLEGFLPVCPSHCRGYENEGGGALKGHKGNRNVPCSGVASLLTSRTSYRLTLTGVDMLKGRSEEHQDTSSEV